jgi:hypothetical protein
VEPGQKVGLVTVHCLVVEERETDVEVTYEYNALSESGRKFLDGFRAENYLEFIAYWKTYLMDYFLS